jgi:hypothetical protein
MKKVTFALLVLLASIPAFAQHELTAGTAWSQPYFTRIDATFSGGAFHARWDINRCSCGDLHILAEETLPQETRTGEQLLVESRALLVRGYENHEGELTALLDSPVLMMQLLYVLLQKAEPSGPAALTVALEPEIAEPSAPVLLDSGIAYGAFPAPWLLSGTITPAPGGRVRYELRFEFDVQDAESNEQQGDQHEVKHEQIMLSGYLDYAEKPFPLEGTSLLDGWSLGWLGRDHKDHPGLKPGMTLGQLRDSL